jgi:hypothetical protein
MHMLDAERDTQISAQLADEPPIIIGRLAQMMMYMGGNERSRFSSLGRPLAQCRTGQKQRA